MSEGNPTNTQRERGSLSYRLRGGFNKSCHTVSIASFVKSRLHQRADQPPLLWKNGRISKERALIGESVYWYKTQRGLVGPALRGRGERDKFSTGWKTVGDYPALHRSYVARGYSVVVGGTAKVGNILIRFGPRYSVRRSGFSGLKLLALTGELKSLNTK